MSGAENPSPQHGEVLHFGADHPALAGHFPGMPIVPGVVLLDQVLLRISAALGIETAHCRINSVKFLSPLLPAQTATLHWQQSSGGVLNFEIEAQGRKIAAGAFRLGLAL